MNITLNKELYQKYAITAKFYDILDFPWERIYRHWRKTILQDVHGSVLEAGVGTGRNFAYYPADVNLTGIDLSPAMLEKAKVRAEEAQCSIFLQQADATLMKDIASNQYDWVISTFMFCVMPDILQPKALEQFVRILKPGARFKLLEMVYSKNPRIKFKQRLFAKFIKIVYGAGFDRHTLDHIQKNLNLKVTGTRFLKDDVYLLIDGCCVK
jgi:ubiquinone/menaquinone biosynthesis C-methylase UbiE